MRHLLLAWAAFTGACLAGPAVTWGPAAGSSGTANLNDAGGLAHSAVRYQWMTDAGGTSCRIGYAKVTGGPYTYQALRTDTQCAGKFHAGYLSGLEANTLYYTVGCVTSGTETCSSEKTFTTSALPSPHPALPAAPTAPDDFAGGAGTTFAVGTDCYDGSTGLVAQFTAADASNAQATVTIPASTICAGIVLPARSRANWITITTANAVLPPDGARITPIYSPQLAKIYNSVPQTKWLTVSAIATEPCFPGQYAWAYDQATGMQLYSCRATGTTITVTGATSSSDLVLTTSAPHGIANCSATDPKTCPMGLIQNVGGAMAGHGNFQLSRVDDTHLKIYTYFDNDVKSSSGAYTGGGTIQPSAFQLIAYTSSAAVPGSCTAGDWFFLTTASPNTAGVYRCATVDGTPKHIIVPMRQVSLGYESSGLDFSTNSVSNVRLLGLDLSTVPWPHDAIQDEFQSAKMTQTGIGTFFQNVNIPSTSTHVIIDRCLIRGGGANQRSWIGVQAEGSHIQVINSYLDGYAMWTKSNLVGTAQYDARNAYESVVINLSAGPGPIKIDNNYIEAYGVSGFVSDDAAPNTATPTDITVTRNYFYHSDAWRLGSPTSNGYYVEVRHHFEAKRGKRLLIQGNQFVNTWQNINSGAGVALTPRGGPGAWINNCAAGSPSTCTTYYAHHLTTGDVVYVSGSSDSTLGSNVYIVGSTPTAVTFTLTGYTGSGGGSDVHIYNIFTLDSVDDVDIRDNTGNLLSAGVLVTGFTDGASYPVSQPIQFQRLRISNNLWNNIDGTRFDSMLIVNNGGWAYLADNGIADVTIANNTSYLGLDYGAPFPLLLHDEGAKHEGLNFHDNLYWNDQCTNLGIGAYGTYFGQAALNTMWTGTSPSWTWASSIAARTGGDGAYGGCSTLPTGGNPYGPYPSGTTYYDLAGGAFPFVSAASQDFRITNPTYATGAAQVAVWAATGVASLQSVTAGSAVAFFRFSAYDGDSCAVSLSTDSFATAASTAWSGSGERLIPASVSASTTYAYRFTCRSYLAVGSITTPAAGGSTTATIQLGGGSASTTISFGATTGLGSTSATTNCASGCTISLPSVTNRARLYYQINYSSSPVTPIQSFIVGATTP